MRCYATTRGALLHVPLAGVLALLSQASAGDFGSNRKRDGLTDFVTRPEIQAPLLNINIQNPARVTPGYWFLAPYEKLIQEPDAPSEKCRTGPHIYDNAGELVWSGACLFDGQNFCDFRVSRGDGDNDNAYFLSGIVYQNRQDERGRGVILDNSYHVQHNVHAPPPVQVMNMHELIYNHSFGNGGRALLIVSLTRYVDTRSLKLKSRKAGWIFDGGFNELDLSTGDPIFEWWASEHVDLVESFAPVENQELARKHSGGWNWFHQNSVDKNSEGDYLLSARFTDTVYKISGTTGSIIWRLGGLRSSFIFEAGLNFTRQHDARWISYNEHKEIISLFDNEADHLSTFASTSSGMVIELDKSTMTAKLLKRWWRPDGQLSRLRGNLQILPNGNAIGGWSDHCYFTEHTPDGEIVFEARAQNERFVTYRTYKFNFTGNPSEPPALQAFVLGSSEEASTTDIFVSWNGATEVDTWRFMNDTDIIGTMDSVGFETKFRSDKAERSVYAEAIAADGTVIGRSVLVEPIWPFDQKQEFDHPNAQTWDKPEL